MVRTPCCDKSGLKKGTWTPEEDSKLMAYVTKYGCLNWRQLPKYAGLSRCGKSCRLRWVNYLRPNIKRGNYSKEEDDIIIQLHKSLGNRWSIIAAHLPGRTDNEIKNHWHTFLKKRSKQNSTIHEPKRSSNDLYTHETVQEKKSEPNNFSLDPSTHRILESFPMSPQPSSSEISSSTTDNSTTNNKKIIREDDVYGWDIFAEASGNFWTEPFLADSYNTINDHLLMAFIDPGLISPPSPVIDEVFHCMHGLYDEHVNALGW